MDQEEGDAPLGDDRLEMLDLLLGDIGQGIRGFAMGGLGFEVDVMAFVYAIVIGGGLGLEIGMRNLRPMRVIDRDYVANMIFGEKDIIVTLGQDGLAVNVMKYLNGQPLIGINPDPFRWEGNLSVFNPNELGIVLPAVIENDYHAADISMAKASTKDGQILYAVNDFFVGVNDHTSARYELNYRDMTENQSSSGIIISTPLGMSGWHKSILAQLRGMAKAFGLGEVEENPVGWYEKFLLFQVREPFPSVNTMADLVYGRVEEDETLRLVSNMPEKGIIFSDGVLEDGIEFSAGMEVTVEVADRTGKLVTW